MRSNGRAFKRLHTKKRLGGFFSRAAIELRLDFIVVLAAVSVSPVFSRHLAAAPEHVRRLQAVQLSARRAAEHVRHLALARRAPEQEPRRLAASSQAAVLPVPGAVPS